MRFLSLSTAGGASLLLSLASSHLAVLARAQANVDNDGPLSPATSGSCADPLHRFVNGHCVPLDLSTDLSHCGQLNHVCPERYQFSVGDVACVAGRCTSECVDGRLFDADKQACVDVLWDAMNCGALGNECPSRGGTARCRAGACSVECDDRQRLSDGSCEEIDIMRDMAHCGKLGRACPSSFMHGIGATCDMGHCKPERCERGFEWSANGQACVSLDTVQNCGKLANACPSDRGDPFCDAGKCAYRSCFYKYKLAGGRCFDVDTDNDVHNCGSVGHECPTEYLHGQGSTCQHGMCRPETCASGYDWDLSINACRDLSFDSLHCGALNNECRTTNGLSRCFNARCVTVSCKPGYRLLNGQCLEDMSARVRQVPDKASKKKKNKPKNLCPKGETACPIAGTLTFQAAQATGFAVFKADDVDAAEETNYECVETLWAVDSCGGCASMDQGKNCQAIENAKSVGCNMGQCVVFRCEPGYEPNLSANACIKSAASALPKRSSTAGNNKHHKRHHLVHGHHHNKF